MSHLIVAVDQDGGMSRQGQLPWQHTDAGRKDMAYFKQVTMGHAVLMGWHTYRSMGRLLPGRLNIIVTRNHGHEAPPAVDGSCRVFDDADAAMAFARQWETQTHRRCYVIGGADLFRHCLRAYTFVEKRITVIPGYYSCDTFYPGTLPKEQPLDKPLFFIQRESQPPHDPTWNVVPEQ